MVGHDATVAEINCPAETISIRGIRREPSPSGLLGRHTDLTIMTLRLSRNSCESHSTDYSPASSPESASQQRSLLGKQIHAKSKKTRLHAD